MPFKTIITAWDWDKIGSKLGTKHLKSQYNFCGKRMPMLAGLEASSLARKNELIGK